MRYWILLVSLLLSLPATALIMVGKGNSPVTDQHWPAGALELANLKTRVGWFEGPPFGGGQWRFQYRGNQAAFEEALAKFGEIKAPELRVVIHEGPGSSEFLKDDKDPKSDTSVDWEFTVWNPESFHRLYNNPQSFFSAEVPEFRGDVAPPQLDVYVTEGRIDWARVQPPTGVTILDERATSNGYKVEDGNVVRGTAYDIVTSKPIPQVEAAIEKYIPPAPGKPNSPQPLYEKVAGAVGDVGGRFEIKQIPGGSYRLVLRCVGYAPRMIGYVSFQKQTFKPFTSHLAPAVEISGIAVDTAGKALEGITVRADNPMSIDGRGYPLPEIAQATTDAAGKFKLGGLPKGHVQLFCYAKGFHTVDVLKLYDVPAEDVKIQLAATGNVKGRVILPAGGAKGQVNVNIVPEGGNKVGSWGGGTNAKEDGSFQFDGVPPGKYYVSTKPMFGDPAKEPSAKPVTVKPGETVEIEIEGR